jgi:hypothetical protein
MGKFSPITAPFPLTRMQKYRLTESGRKILMEIQGE